MMSMLLPEFVQSVSFSFFDEKMTVSDFKSFFFEFFDNFRLGIFLINGKMSFSLVESDIR